MFFFDENSLIRQINLNEKINNQKQEIKRLKKIIENDTKVITIINSDSLNHDLEKILREEYLLSKPNEIIYKIEN